MPEPLTNEAAIAASMLPSAVKWIAALIGSLLGGLCLLITGRSITWFLRVNREIQQSKADAEAQAKAAAKRDTETAEFRHEMTEWMKRLEEQIHILAQAEAVRCAVEGEREKHPQRRNVL